MNFQVITWLVILVVMVIAEFATMGLATIWFAGGAVAGFVAALAGAPVPVQIVLFFAVSFVLLIFTRPLVKKSFNIKREKTNAESLIGENAVVLEPIDNLTASGLVQIRGQEWTARAKDRSQKIPKDEIVKIVAIEGVKLIVEKIVEENETANTIFEE
ncbi:MAG: NfeD family protein [Eubacterium sp.]|nr:NfeD family protein [Eubacterium sp.]